MTTYSAIFPKNWLNPMTVPVWNTALWYSKSSVISRKSDAICDSRDIKSKRTKEKEILCVFVLRCDGEERLGRLQTLRCDVSEVSYRRAEADNTKGKTTSEDWAQLCTHRHTHTHTDAGWFQEAFPLKPPALQWGIWVTTRGPENSKISQHTHTPINGVCMHVR